jgi:hypothetical protein
MFHHFDFLRLRQHPQKSAKNCQSLEKNPRLIPVKARAPGRAAPGVMLRSASSIKFRFGI